MKNIFEAPSSERTGSAVHELCGLIGADPTTEKRLEKFLKRIPPLPENGFEAAKAIRSFLIKSGFTYHPLAFLPEDVLRKKAGNCLGLTVLIGVILKERGFSPSYEVVLNPHDAIYRQDLRLMDELKHGEHFRFDEAPLPDQIGEFRDYRFVPLEHPDILLDGQRFETTSLDEEQGPEANWSLADAERMVSISFPQLISNLYIDQGRIQYNHPLGDPKRIKEFYQKGLALWPENREAWADLRGLAVNTFDDELVTRATEAYAKIGGDDSRFHFQMYRWNKERHHLDRALEMYPGFVDAFVEKYVVQEQDDQEARFNFSVAAYCIANSSELNLRIFYLNHADFLKKWHGVAKAQKLFRKLAIRKHQPFGYAMAETFLQQDTKPLVELVESGFWPTMPEHQLRMCLLLQDEVPKCAEVLARLREEHGHSNLFKIVCTEMAQ